MRLACGREARRRSPDGRFRALYPAWWLRSGGAQKHRPAPLEFLAVSAVLAGLLVLLYQHTDRYRMVEVQPRTSPSPGAPLQCTGLIKKAVSEEDNLDPGARDVLTLLADTFDRPRLAAFTAKQVSKMHVGTAVDARVRLEASASTCRDEALPKLGFCAVSSGSAPYVQEWIAHHLLLGARKIALYDSDEPRSERSREFRRAVTPFIDAGYVDVVDWPSRSSFGDTRASKPAEVRDHCLDKYRSGLDWLAMTDLDEFVVLHPSASGGCLTRLLAEHGESGNLLLPLREFAPLGVPIHDHSNTTIDQYRYARSGKSGEPVQCKSVINVKHIERMSQPESTAYATVCGAVDPPTNATLAQMFVRPPPGEPYTTLELRRYWARGMQHMFLEKVCGLPPEQGSQAEANARAAAHHVNSRNFAYQPEDVSRQREPLNKFLFGR